MKRLSGLFVILLVIAAPHAASAVTTLTTTGIDTDGFVVIDGNTTLGDAATDLITLNGTIQGGTAMIFEGATADGFETSFTITDPDADRTITFPNASGEVSLLGQTIDLATEVTGTIGDGALSANIPRLDTAGTITGDWVNTANPWADNEVSDTLTIGAGGSVADGALSANVSLLGSSISDAEVDDNITISGTGSVADGALSANVSLLGSSIDLGSEVTGTIGDGSLSVNIPRLDTAGTITGDWVNTANPWADNEVSDTLTIGAGGSVADGALSANVSLLGSSITDGEVSDSITIGSSGSVDAGALTFITGDGVGATTSDSGLELEGDALGLLQGCDDGEILKWVNGTTSWDCAADATGGTADIFRTFSVPSGTNPVADSATDTMTFAAGSSDITITGDSGTDTITFDIADSFLENTGDTATGIFDFTAAVLSGALALVFEGATADDFEYSFNIPDPSADRTLTFPTLGGTLATLAGTESLSNKTLPSAVINGSPNAASAVWSNLGSVTTVDINGGTIDGVTINGSSPGPGTFTTLQANTSVTIGSSGDAITEHLSATASLNFTAALADTCQDLTISVTGAEDGDTVALGIPNAAAGIVGAQFTGFVSAADTVTVRLCNPTAISLTDPPASTFRADVWKH